MTEIVRKRRENAKVFALNDGQRLVRTSVGPAHFEAAGAWADIDLTPRQVDGALLIDAAPYRLRTLEPPAVGFAYRSKRGGQIRFRLDRLAGVAVAAIEPESGDGLINWRNVGQALDVALQLRPQGVALAITWKAAAAPRSLRWIVDTDRANRFAVALDDMRGKDDQRRTVRIESAVSDVASPNVDATRRRLELTLHDEIMTRDKQTRIRSWTPGVLAFPVLGI
jgi:hypothetical protein